MKHKILLWLMLFFFPLALGTACNTEVDLKSIRYEGEVLMLEGKSRPYNIIRVTKSSSSKGLPVGVALGFVGTGYDKQMSEGDIVHFHVIDFKEWQWPKTEDLRWPMFIGIVEFYDN